MALQFLLTFLIIFLMSFFYANIFYTKGEDLDWLDEVFAALGMVSLVGIFISAICAVWGL